MKGIVEGGNLLWAIAWALLAAYAFDITPNPPPHYIAGGISVICSVLHIFGYTIRLWKRST